MGYMPKASGIVAEQQEISAKITEKQLAEAYNEAQNMQLRLEESMSNLSLMLDGQGWIELSEYPTDGPSLAQIQDAGRKLRNLAGLNSHIGRGKRQRHAYIWEGGIHHDNIPTGGKQGVSNVQKVIDDPVNQANFFGATAREVQEGACYTNGIYMVVGEDGKPGTPKRLRNLPLYQITAHMVNPDDPTEVWAVRRSWSTDGVIENDNRSPGARGDLEHEWIFVHEHKGKETADVKYNGGTEKVNKKKRVFIEIVNRQDGWTWGLPDAVAAMAWADQYRRGVLNGLKMQEALATLAFKLKAQTAKGANNAAAKVADSANKGGTAAMVDGMDITALATAGRGYDFDSLRPVLSIVATSLDVSVVALSSDPGAAGSSYGAGQLLDLPTKLAMEARREVHIQFERQILNWLGAPDARVWFNSLTDGTELYRAVQAILLKWSTGMYEAEEIKSELEGLFGHETIGPIPDGILLPNNKDSLPRKDIDSDGVATTTPAPNQGQADGVGGDGDESGNDVRTDTLT